MTNDLSTLLRDAAPTPRTEVDVDAVVERARQLSCRRVAVAATVTALAVVAGSGIVATLDRMPEPPVVGEADSGLPAPGTYEDGALVVGRPGEVPEIDLSVTSRLEGRPLATLDRPADEIAVASDGAIGTFTHQGGILRIVLDGQEVAQTLLSPILRGLAEDDPTVDDWPNTAEQRRERAVSIAFDDSGTLWLSVGGSGGAVLGLGRDGNVTATAGPQQEGQQLRVVGDVVSVIAYSTGRYGQVPASGTVTAIQGRDPLAGSHPVPVPSGVEEGPGDRGTTIGDGAVTTASILGAGRLALRGDPGPPDGSRSTTWAFVSAGAQVADTDAAVVHRTGMPAAVLVLVRDDVAIGGLLDATSVASQERRVWLTTSPDGAVHLAEQVAPREIRIRTLLGPDLQP